MNYIRDNVYGRMSDIHWFFCVVGCFDLLSFALLCFDNRGSQGDRWRWEHTCARATVLGHVGPVHHVWVQREEKQKRSWRVLCDLAYGLAFKFWLLAICMHWHAGSWCLVRPGPTDSASPISHHPDTGEVKDMSLFKKKRRESS